MRSACLSVTLAAIDDQCPGLIYALGCRVVILLILLCLHFFSQNAFFFFFLNKGTSPPHLLLGCLLLLLSHFSRVRLCATP